MKDHSFYQFALTARGRKDEKGELAEEILMICLFHDRKKIFMLYQITLKCKEVIPFQCLFLIVYMMNILNG